MSLPSGIIIFVLAIISLIYLFLTSPRLSGSADMELLTCNYAHRGLHGDRIPENSLRAFEYAARRGYGIELDIRLTKDEKIVVFHDDNLSRMCGISKKVNELTLAELRTLRLSGTNEVIPTLAEVLRLIDGRVPLLIEVKGSRPNDRLCRGASEMLDKYRGAFCIEAFSPLVLAWFKRYRPLYARGQLVNSAKGYKSHANAFMSFMLSNMLLNFISRPDFLAMKFKKRNNIGLILASKAFHVPVFIWTIKTPEDYMTCNKLGYYTIFEKILPKEK